jgi:hypothetical protein
MTEGAGTRTQDLRIKSPLLYRLSYAFAALVCRAISILAPPCPIDKAADARRQAW